MNIEVYTDTLEALGYGVLIKKIVTRPYSIFEMRHYKEGDEIITWGNRQMVKRTNPKHKNEGKWRVGLINGDGSSNMWDRNTILCERLEDGLSQLLDMVRAEGEK